MDPWAVLGVAPGSSQRAIREAYIRRSKQLHPDLGGTDEAMQELNAAYDTLSSGNWSRPGSATAADPTSPATPRPAPAAAARPAAAPQYYRSRPRRPPLYRRWGFYVALVLAAVVFAGSGATRDPDPSQLPRSDRDLVGSCVVIDGDAFTRAESCAAPHDGRVTAVVLRTQTCPHPWTAYFNRNYDRVCVDERQ